MAATIFKQRPTATVKQAQVGLFERTLLAALVGLTALSAVLLGVQAATPEPIELPGITIDRVTATIALLVSGISVVVYRFAGRYLDGEQGQRAFLRRLAFTAFSAFVLILATNLLLLFGAWICTSLGLHQLLTHYRDRFEALAPARKKMLISRLGDVALVLAIGLVAWQWGTVDLKTFMASIDEPASWQHAPTAVALLVVAAALAKSAQFPFHSWLPETMEAPTPVSALMHAGIINAGGVLLLHFAPLLVQVPVSLLLLTVVGTVTAVLGTMAMWAQTNVKRTLAWSTVSQMGFMMVQFGLAAFPAAILHLVGHGCYKAWSFLRTGELPRRKPSARKLSPVRTLLIALTGAIVAIPALFLAATTTGFDPLHSPGELALTGIVALSLGQLWVVIFQSGPASASGQIRRAVSAGVVTFAGAFLALGLYHGAARFYSPALGVVEAPEGPLAWVSAAVPFIAFALLAVLHSLLPVLGKSRKGRAFYVYALHGFYFGAIADRVVARIWSVGKGSPPAVAPARSTAHPVSASHPLEELLDDALAVGKRIPPLWDLPNYVAVNPYLGFSSQPVAAAFQTISDGLDARALPPVSFYREQWRSGAFGKADLALAASSAGYEVAPLIRVLDGEAPAPRRTILRMRTNTERFDLEHGTRWNDLLIRQVTTWCAVQIPDELPNWGGSLSSTSLFQSWREMAVIDRSPEVWGLRGWREWAARLPETPEEALSAALEALHIEPEERRAYFYRLLAGVFGWASYLRRDTWVAGDLDAGPLLDLLAIRACTEAAVDQLAPRMAALGLPAVEAETTEDEAVRMVFQEALEDAYVHRMKAGFKPAHEVVALSPAIQAVFCIDVRSEVFRRHLEAQSTQIETRGFAGFFGVLLDWHSDDGGSNRCPVLLSPALQAHSSATAPVRFGEMMVKRLTAAPAAAYTFVETLGLGYALRLAGDALCWLPSPRADEGAAAFAIGTHDANGRADEATVALAATILKNMGLRRNFGRIVLLAGHEGHSENNSHQAGLDCGACGGHGGAPNARIAASLLNDASVRDALEAFGYRIPAETHFLPGLHDTGLDEVRLLDVDKIPAGHESDLAQLQQWLVAAGAGTRKERAASLGIVAESQEQIDRSVRKRVRDWSEVRPEWALARNAAFVAARRKRTRGVNLDGRAFLHEYDWTTDPDNSVLTLILTAPMVVASWINLQYFGSTVDNSTFGCGTKTLHNRVGTAGVVLGNGGDLRTGLALQSVESFDGGAYHEPLRLQVIVEAPQERIAAVIAAHQGLRDLVDNGWVRLFALDPNGPGVVRWIPGAGWAGASVIGDHRISDAVPDLLPV